MKSLSRKAFSALALAAVLMGAVSLPALATETDPAVPPGTHSSAATEAVRPAPARPAGKQAGAPAAMTAKAGSHASATTGAPSPATPGQAPVSSKTN